MCNTEHIIYNTPNDLLKHNKQKLNRVDVKMFLTEHYKLFINTVSLPTRMNKG